MILTVIAAKLVNAIVPCANCFSFRGKAKKYLKKGRSNCIPEVWRVRFRKANSTIVECSNTETIGASKLKKETIRSSKEVDVPVRPSRRRKCDNVKTTKTSGQTDKTNASSVTNNENVVEAEIHGIASPTGKEIPNSLKSKSTSHDVNSTSDESPSKPLAGEGSSVTFADTKNDSSEKLETRKTIGNDKAEVSSLKVPQGSSSQQPSIRDHSTMYQINRVDNASTSTKINLHSLPLKDFDIERMVSVTKSLEESLDSAERYNSTILKEILQFLSLEEKDCAIDLCTSIMKRNADRDVTEDDDSEIVRIQIRKYRIKHEE